MRRLIILGACCLEIILCGGYPARSQSPANSPSPAPPAQKADQTAPPAAAPASATGSSTADAVPPRPAKVLIPVGTRLPLVLHNGISTRNARPGDPVYLETLFPILIDGRIMIPAGSYVSGEITEAKRPGRVKGRGEIMLRLTTLILPNGYSVNLLATPNDASTGDEDTVDKEGKIKSATNKSGDVGTVAKTTAAGAGIGAIAGRGKGAGIGAGIGAAAGLATVLLTRGPELELPRGTTLDVMLDRPLYLDSEHAQFTDPGRASTLPGPPNRQPARSTAPF